MLSGWLCFVTSLYASVQPFAVILDSVACRLFKNLQTQNWIVSCFCQIISVSIMWVSIINLVFWSPGMWQSDTRHVVANILEAQVVIILNGCRFLWNMERHLKTSVRTYPVMQHYIPGDESPRLNFWKGLKTAVILINF